MNKILTLIAFFQLQGVCWADPADESNLILHPQQINLCTPLLETLKDNSLYVAYAEALANFNDASIRIVAPWISFTPEEIAATITALSNTINYDHNQMTFSLTPDGSLEKVPAWYNDKSTLSNSVAAKLQIFASDLVKIYSLAKGHSPKQVGLSLRITSDSIGQSVTHAYGGDLKNGLHNHLPAPGSKLERKRNSIDFVWAIAGLGPRILINDTIMTAPENTISFIGIEVPHGSPPSKKLRLLIVGSASE